MNERAVSVAEAKAHLSELVAAAEAGEEVVITKRGKRVAALVGCATTKKRVELGWLRQRTEDMPMQEDDSGSFLRHMRDAERY